MIDNKRELFLNNPNITKLIISCSIPPIISGIVEILYSYTDSIFIGHFIDKNALAAISVNIAIQSSLFAIGTLFIMGTNSNISRALGANDTKRVGSILQNGLFFGMGFATIFSLSILSNLRNVLFLVGSSTEIIQFSIDYAQIILWFAPINIGSFILIGSIRAKGYASVAMRCSLSGAFCNIILDTLFIVVLRLGISGAAWATVISQTLVFMLGLRYVLKLYKSEIHQHFQVNKQIIWDIIKIGVPTGFRIGIFALTYILGNRVLREYGADTMAAYSITMRTSQFTMVIAAGISAGMQPLIGFNYGAEIFTRVRRILNIGLLINLAFIIPLSIFYFSAPAFLFQIFTPSIETVSIGQEAIKIIGTATCAYSIAFITVDSLQAMGFYKLSFLVSTATPTLICIGLVFFPPILGRVGVWNAYLVAYLTLMIASILIIIRENRRLSLLSK